VRSAKDTIPLDAEGAGGALTRTWIAWAFERPALAIRAAAAAAAPVDGALAAFIGGPPVVIAAAGSIWFRLPLSCLPSAPVMMAMPRNTTNFQKQLGLIEPEISVVHVNYVE
jgi:hypothetical protein